MKHKFAIIFSTVMLFIVAVILSAAWLLKTRYFVVKDINGTIDGDIKSNVYSYVDETLENNFKGKWIFAYDKNDVTKLLKENPYIGIIDVKKSFPDKLVVEIYERKERFAIAYKGKYYITDSEYHYLRVADEIEESKKDKLICVDLKNIDNIDFSAVPLGEEVKFNDELCFTAMTEIFQGFSDKLNFIDKIICDGERNTVDFYTMTGVVINVNLSVATTTEPTKDDFKNTCDKICKESKNIEKYYNSLGEGEKRAGYIRVFQTEDSVVRIIHEFSVDEGNTEGKNA